MDGGKGIWGYDVPFERLDLLVSLITVAAFLPVVVIIHTIVVKTYEAFTKIKQH